MIRYVGGNLLDDDAEALVNPVNCVGVMGAGLARQFKERFPASAQLYGIACHEGTLKPGYIYCSGSEEGRWIVHFPTKKHWKNPSDITWIDDGLCDLARFVRDRGIRSIALPMLGCGLGGLDWAEVRPLIELAFEDLPGVDVRVYGPPS